MIFDKKLFGSKYVEPEKRVPVDTLVLVGNGFDVWQGFPTSYHEFETYYKEHVGEVLSRLHLSKRVLMDSEGEAVLDLDGNPMVYCDVELFYGDPKNPRRLPHEFWGSFEVSLDKVDDQEINFFFGKDREGLNSIRRCAQNAQRILQEIFCDWIQSLEITEREPEYDFGENCLFINFNYTDTLQKRFGVQEIKEYHIHGSANERESIIFGHATHPEMAYEKLQMGKEHPRFQGLYHIEEFLYNSDKHVEDNYMKLQIFLALHGVRIEQIKKIYVLGLGFWEADLGYIKNLVRDTTGICADPEAYLSEEELAYLNGLDEYGKMNLNIQYAIDHRKRVMQREAISYPEYEMLDRVMYEVLEDPYYRMDRDGKSRLEAAAVRRRFLEEQEQRNNKIKKEYLRLLQKKSGCGWLTPVEAFLEAAPELKASLSGAEWHISYYTEEDRKRIDRAMSSFGCKTYELHPTIEECLEAF